MSSWCGSWLNTRPTLHGNLKSTPPWLEKLNNYYGSLITMMLKRQGK
jgi:hypothetical protein